MLQGLGIHNRPECLAILSEIGWICSLKKGMDRYALKLTPKVFPSVFHGIDL